MKIFCFTVKSDSGFYEKNIVSTVTTNVETVAILSRIK